MLKTYPRNSTEQISKHFKAHEFDCPCGCHDTQLDSDLLEKADALRDRCGIPLQITSGYRCEKYQEELKLKGYETAKGISQHQIGRAFDCKAQGLTGLELEAYARSVGFMAVGVGKAFIHCDLRDARERRWTYSY